MPTRSKAKTKASESASDSAKTTTVPMLDAVSLDDANVTADDQKPTLDAALLHELHVALRTQREDIMKLVATQAEQREKIARVRANSEQHHEEMEIQIQVFIYCLWSFLLC